MRKSFVALMLAFGAIATLATGAFANPRDVFSGSDDNVKKMYLHPLHSSAARLGSSALSADTTWVGYNPAYATKTNNRGQANYWSVGVGGNEPPAGGDNSRRGYWDWENPVHGDSLMGWWPVRFPYTSNTGLNANDALRQWQVDNTGNNVNYVINQGAGFKRTYGVVGEWHADKGNVIDSVQAGTNPSTPGWTPLSGSRSAWCGLRGHGDRSVKDPITGNPFTVEAMPMTFEQGLGIDGLGTSRQFPGYQGLMDQMLYRDVPVPTGGNPLKIQFKLATQMSTGKLTGSNRAGWFVYDTYSQANGNFISASANLANAPIDSFQVYVGRPVEPVAGANNDYVGSDGASHEIFDPLRRWLSEVIAIQGGSAANTPHWLYGTVGNNAAGTVSLSIPASQVTPYGSTVHRLPHQDEQDVRRRFRRQQRHVRFRLQGCRAAGRHPGRRQRWWLRDHRYVRGWWRHVAEHRQHPDRRERVALHRQAAGSHGARRGREHDRICRSLRTSWRTAQPVQHAWSCHFGGRLRSQ
jgi:hypothetical protein